MIYTTKELLEAAKNAVPKADLVSLRIHRESGNSFIAHNSLFEGTSHSSDVGFMVEVLYNGHLAYAASQDLTPTGVADAVRKAFNAAKVSVAFKIAHFDSSIRPDTKLKYETPRNRKTFPSKVEIFEYLISICDSLKVSDEIIDTRAYTYLQNTEIELLTSEGGEVFQTRNVVSSNFGTTARRNEIIQHRHYHGPGARAFQIGSEFLNLKNDLEKAKQIGMEAVELLGAENCPTDTRTLVLLPDQMMLQIHESVGHPLEIDRIIGDERNYAGGSFIKPEDIGSFQYGSNLMNIVFDPTVSEELAAYGADETGLIAKKRFIIKEGKLVSALGGIESAFRLYKDSEKIKEQVTANQRATSWNRPPIDRMANINLEPGTSSFDTIISSVEKGILMHSNRSWSIDDYRNKFQFGCEYAKLIENGKITKTVKNPNYRGVSQTFWKSLSAVGDSSTFEIYATPNCGKGEPNQSIFVGHASPVCAFSDVEVFGGGK